MPDTLLQRVAANDARAVRDCIDRYAGLVWSLARRLCGPGSEAEDAVQDVFVSLWRSAARFDPAVASEPTFVAMIARRRLIDRARARSRRPTTEPVPAHASSGGESAPRPATPRVDLTEEAMRAARALTDLPPEQQRVLRLSIYQGLSHEQIVTATGLPLGTVKTHIRRGLIRVRDALAGQPRKGVAT